MRKKDDTKKKRIQDATAAIILKQGAAAVSTVKVAKRVGISQSNVYLYFKNKDDLLLSVYQRELARINFTGDFERIRDPQLPVTQRLQLYLRSIFEYALAHPESMTLIQQIKFLMGRTDDNPLADQMSNNVVVALLKEAQSAKVIKMVPINVMMAMVFAAVQTHAQNLIHQQYGPSDYQFHDFYQLIWDAFRLE